MTDKIIDYDFLMNGPRELSAEIEELVRIMKETAKDSKIKIVIDSFPVDCRRSA